MSVTPKLGLLLLMLLAWSAPARAQEPAIPAGGAVELKAAPEPAFDAYASTTKGAFYYQNEYELKARKLARGFCNVVLCPAEVPNQMFREAYRSSPISGAFVGFFRGVCKGGKRLVMGTWEIVTFYNPGNNHYQPFIEPEVVFMEYVH